MKVRKLLLIAFSVVCVLCCSLCVSACFLKYDPGSGNPEKRFTIICPNEMIAGDRIEITIWKSYDFEMKNSDYEWKIIGENTVDGSFEFEDLNKNDNYTNKFFRAYLPGTVKIQATNSTSGLLTSNIVEITVKGNYISTVGELKAIANTDASYTLGADIDLSSESNWTPIQGFTGTLSGGEYSIKNLSITVKSSDNVGLFSELKGIVNNLKIENVNISGTGSGGNIGAIAGKNSGTIRNCEVDGTINCSYSSCVGGIAGYSNAKVNNCVSNINITAYQKVGGIVGYIPLYTAEEITGNVNKGNVSGNSYVGGVIGMLEGDCPDKSGTYTTSLTECSNEGEIKSSGNYAGGIAGYTTGYYGSFYFKDYTVYLEFSDCENAGAVNGGDYVGGIYGYGKKYVKTVAACVNGADISGGNYVGGYVGYSPNTSLMNMQNGNSVTGKGYVGGVAGYAGNILNCKNSGTVISTGIIIEDNTSKYCLGGIAGYCTGASGCVNTADISVGLDGRRVGGIAGEIYGSYAVENNINSGVISAPKANTVGGIAGKILVETGIDIKENRNEADVSGVTYIGGIVGYLTSDCPEKAGTYTTNLVDNENNGKITASDDYAGGIAGQANGYYGIYYFKNFYVYIGISGNANNNSVESTGSNYGAIVGKTGNYVNSTNSVLWETNTDTAEVGKLYN